jgi:hypothetical protein
MFRLMPQRDIDGMYVERAQAALEGLGYEDGEALQLRSDERKRCDDGEGDVVVTRDIIRSRGF